MDQPLLIRVPDTMPPTAPQSASEDWTHDREPMPLQFIVGVDLGQARDYSTIVVNHLHAATREHHTRSKFQIDGPTLLREEIIAYHRLRYVSRIPLGTSYPAVVARVASVLAQLPPAPREPQLVVDGTGVGRPVLDLMRRDGLKPFGVTITTGASEVIEANDARVAKLVLATGVGVALDTGRLTVPATGSDVEVLKSELRTFRVKQSTAGNDSFEAFREADHDDLLLAAAIAIWFGERAKLRYRVNPEWRLLGR